MALDCLINLVRDEVSIIMENEFKKEDKVIHYMSGDDKMIGTVKDCLNGNKYLVEFFIPGRNKPGYKTEIEFFGSELEPCYIDVESIKRNSTHSV